jgi:hypothetical protein
MTNASIVEETMVGFDYSAAAELFSTRNRQPRRRPIGLRQPVGYKRFAHAADAIRFAIEELPAELLLGAFLQIDEERYDSGGIHRLYESRYYPLIRGVAA